jgi:hypothetical protein
MPNLKHIVDAILADRKPLATHLVRRHTGYAATTRPKHEERLQ